METHLIAKIITFLFVGYGLLALVKCFVDAGKPAASKLGKARAAHQKINRKVDHKVAKTLAEVKKAEQSANDWNRPRGATPTSVLVSSPDIDYSRYESPSFVRKLAKEAQAS